MNSLSPDLIEAISVSVSAFGTITNLATFGAADLSQYLSFGTRMSWSLLHAWIFHGRAENGMLSCMSPETSSQFLSFAFSIRLENMFLYGAYTVLNLATTCLSLVPFSMLWSWS